MGCGPKGLRNFYRGRPSAQLRVQSLSREKSLPQDDIS